LNEKLNREKNSGLGKFESVLALRLEVGITSNPIEWGCDPSLESIGRKHWGGGGRESPYRSEEDRLCRSLMEGTKLKTSAVEKEGNAGSGESRIF